MVQDKIAVLSERLNVAVNMLDDFALSDDRPCNLEKVCPNKEG